MTVWNNCKADIIYYDGEADIDEHCEVKIDKDEIIVSYAGENGPVVYKGKNNGDGHFELSASIVNGHATLHRLKYSNILEGFWLEDGYKGMWRIKLA
ncbi:MAG TPA: hypothetical protein PLG94_14690, partial [Smithellaceae bacterium]|nr:hypothetical protein [Smithellaceae bacterium]